MNTLFRYSDITGRLTDSFRHRHGKDVSITGVLLARPEDPFVRDQILPRLRHWNYRSDFFTEFFCAGYTDDSSAADPGSGPIAQPDDRRWYFSTRAFNGVVNAIESATTWRYESGAQLLLTNARYDRARETAELDFLQAMVVDLGATVARGGAHDADEIAGRIFEFAKSINEHAGSIDNPLYEYSARERGRVLRYALRALLLVESPVRLRHVAADFAATVVRDLRRSEG